MTPKETGEQVTLELPLQVAMISNAASEFAIQFNKGVNIWIRGLVTDYHTGKQVFLIEWRDVGACNSDPNDQSLGLNTVDDYPTLWVIPQPGPGQILLTEREEEDLRPEI